MLPKPPSWKCCEITVEGGTTKTPIKFFHRDAWECLCFLFGNPIFDGHLDLAPYKSFEDDFQKVRLYGNPNSGQYPWRVQVSLFFRFSIRRLLNDIEECCRRRRDPRPSDAGFR